MFALMARAGVVFFFLPLCACRLRSARAVRGCMFSLRRCVHLLQSIFSSHSGTGWGGGGGVIDIRGAPPFFRVVRGSLPVVARTFISPPSHVDRIECRACRSARASYSGC